MLDSEKVDKFYDFLKNEYYHGREPEKSDLSKVGQHQTENRGSLGEHQNHDEKQSGWYETGCVR